jgi:hypothetical protein
LRAGAHALGAIMPAQRRDDAWSHATKYAVFRDWRGR